MLRPEGSPGPGRARLLGRAGALVGFVVAQGACERVPPPLVVPPPRPVSLLLITSDTTRADAVSAYGDARAMTPHVDALARRGLLAPIAYSATDVTSPSHTTLMTGLAPVAHGVYSFHAPLPARHDTLAEALQRAGYGTAALVSVHHLRGEMSGLDQGFESYEVPRTERPAESTLAMARDCLAALQPPFFVWTHFFDPHMPYEPPTPWRALALDAGDAPALPPLEELIGRGNVPFPYRDWLELQDLRTMRARYWAEVSAVDHAIGRLVKLARRADPETVVAVTADHGEGFGEHEIYWNHSGLFEEMTRVPLAIEAPGRLAPGSGIAGAFPSSRLKGVLLALARGKPVSLAPHGPTTTEMRFHAAASVLSGRHKLVVQRGAAPPLVPGTRLYDLEVDPNEIHDRSAEDPERRIALQAELRRLLEVQGGRAPEKAPAVTLSDEAREKLRALGYVE